MKKLYLVIISLIISNQFAHAQFVLDGEFRPRSEYRHGFGTLIADEEDPGFGISTRLRLNAGYSKNSYSMYLSLQDVFVWGENRQLLPVDSNNSFAVFEAWVSLKLGRGWSTKLGRQTINYDDQRIFGGVDWAQQARTHDAGLINFESNKFKLDIGLAFNQDKSDISGFSSVGTDYTTAGFFSYKSMQYMYLKQQWEFSSVSFLALNNIFQDLASEVSANTVSSLLTVGSHLTYYKGSFKLDGNIFVQNGNRQNDVDVKGAYLAGLDIRYKASTKVGFSLGAEIISGKKEDSAAFFPLFGTNHKFNGFMDYFYVGNHVNSIGLVDIHVSADLAFSDTSNLLVKALHFRGDQELPSGEHTLGTEIDLVFSKKFKDYSLALGYSQLFAANGMYELKGISKDVSADAQNWAWVMLVIKPEFLNSGQ